MLQEVLQERRSGVLTRLLHRSIVVICSSVRSTVQAKKKAEVASKCSTFIVSRNEATPPDVGVSLRNCY